MKTKIFVLLFGFGLAYQDTGYPAGLIADCPGMNRNTSFSEETKKSLSVVVMWPTTNIFEMFERRCKLSAGGAAYAAKYLNFKKRKTQVLISGYLDASFSPLVRSIANRYLALNRNVIVLEIFPVLVHQYPIAARLTKPLGVLLGEFLAELTWRGLSPSKLEIIGGSLGAHIASYAAVKYTELTGRQPARLTGLDPAGPCFRNLPPSERFNANAAVKVDALHTNIDGFGMADAVAQIDFYANGGEYQPSMIGNFILPCFVICSHIRGALYWNMATEYPNKFLAVRCNSVADARHGNCYDGNVEINILGPKTNFSQHGIYYLPTREFPPYFMGEDGLTKRAYGANTYLLQVTKDEDLIV